MKTHSPTKQRTGKTKVNPHLNLEVKSESSKAIQTWTLQNQLLKQKQARERTTSVSSRGSEASETDRSSTSTRSSENSSISLEREFRNGKTDSSFSRFSNRQLETDTNSSEPQLQFQTYTSNKFDNTYTFDQENDHDGPDSTLTQSQQELQSRLVIQEAEEQVDWKILEEREEVNNEIYKNASRLRESMMLIAQYVNEQEEMVEDIANNVDVTYERVRSGVQHLEEAHELQKKTPCTIM